MKLFKIDQNFAADYPILYDFTIPRSLPSPSIYFYIELVVKTLRDFPQFKRFFSTCYHVGIQLSKSIPTTGSY